MVAHEILVTAQKIGFGFLGDILFLGKIYFLHLDIWNEGRKEDLERRKEDL